MSNKKKIVDNKNKAFYFYNNAGKYFYNCTKVLLFIYLSLASFIFIGYQVIALMQRYSLDYGEAVIVDQGMVLANGSNLYRIDITTPPYTISNYPPVYVCILAIFVKMFSPASVFFYGRLVSVISTLIAGVCIGRIVYVATRSRISGFCSALILFAFPYVVYWSPLVRIDMVALGLSALGLWILVEWPGSKSGVKWAGLLLVAAIYTRQSYALAAPMAGFFWLLSCDIEQIKTLEFKKQIIEWRSFQLFIIVCILTLLIFILLNGYTEGGFFYHIVTATKTSYDIDRLKWNFERFFNETDIILFIGGLSIFILPKWNRIWCLSIPYLIGAVLSAAAIGKIGSNVNYFVELCAALAISTGLIIAWIEDRIRLQAVKGLLVVLLSIGIMNMVSVTLHEYTSDLKERIEYADDLRKLETLVADAPGTVLADEYMGMITLQGRYLYLQPFSFAQLSKDGLWDQNLLLKRIKNREFSFIIIYDKPWKSERWTDEMLATIDNHYVLISRLAGNKIYRAL